MGNTLRYPPAFPQPRHTVLPGGQWDLSGFWALYSGLHFNPSLATSVSGSLAVPGSSVERPNLNGIPNLPVGQRTIDHWFNVAAFSTPAPYTFGNSGAYVLEGPGYFSTDMGIHRVFPMGEAKRLTFRWEMFNAVNRANFNNPNASIGSGSAGVISGTLSARSMQMSLKFNF